MAHLEGVPFHWRKLKQIRVSCPLCGADSSHSEVYERYGDELQYSLARCTKCRMIFQNPRYEWNDEFLKWAYSWYGDNFIQLSSPFERQALVAGSEGYFAFKKKIIERYCQARPYRLLDVGCACGQFLSFCHGKDCVATGVEASERQVEFIRKNLDFEAIYGITTNMLPKYKGAFDVTHIAHTLEHVPEPLETIRELTELTAPNGLIFIEVPNVKSLQNYRNHLFSKYGLRKNKWQPHDFPEHLVEFSPKTLRRLVERAGLEIVHFETHSKKTLDRKNPLAVPLDRFLNRFVPVSNNMICVARKPA